MWWVSGEEQRLIREMIKWPIMQSCMGSKDLGFVAVLETEGHHTATNISVDTLCRLVCTVKRGVEGLQLESYCRNL